MKKNKNLILILLLFCLSNLINAQDNEDLVSYYDSEIIKINYNLWGGLGFTFQGRNISPFFGINSDFKKTLSMDPDVKKYIDDYSFQNTTGHVLLWGGTATMLLSPLLLVLFNNSFNNFNFPSETQPYYYPVITVAIIGAISVYISPFFFIGSYENLINGVNVYNRNNWKKY